MEKSKASFFFREEDVEFDKLFCIGEITIGKYLNQFNLDINIETEPVSLKIITQRERLLSFGEREYLPALICLPHPSEKHNKPSGLYFEDYSFLQIKEVLLQDIKSKKLYLYEYSYDYSVLDEIILKKIKNKNIYIYEYKYHYSV